MLERFKRFAAIATGAAAIGGTEPGCDPKKTEPAPTADVTPSNEKEVLPSVPQTTPKVEDRVEDQGMVEMSEDEKNQLSFYATIIKTIFSETPPKREDFKAYTAWAKRVAKKVPPLVGSYVDKKLKTETARSSPSEKEQRKKDIGHDILQQFVEYVWFNADDLEKVPEFKQLLESNSIPVTIYEDYAEVYKSRFPTLAGMPNLDDSYPDQFAGFRKVNKRGMVGRVDVLFVMGQLKEPYDLQIDLD